MCRALLRGPVRLLGCVPRARARGALRGGNRPRVPHFAARFAAVLSELCLVCSYACAAPAAPPLPAARHGTMRGVGGDARACCTRLRRALIGGGLGGGGLGCILGGAALYPAVAHARCAALATRSFVLLPAQRVRQRLTLPPSSPGGHKLLRADWARCGSWPACGALRRRCVCRAFSSPGAQLTRRRRDGGAATSSGAGRVWPPRCCSSWR